MDREKIQQDQSTEASRREFLKKAGKLAVYTPPALMVMMHPSRKAMACSWGGGGFIRPPRPPKQGFPWWPWW